MDRQYPTGRFDLKAVYTLQNVPSLIEEIKALPKKIQNELYYAEVDQLNTPYREGGWTIKQVVHHLGDSHMNALMRFKLALTEDNPTIKPYDEKAWSQTADYIKVPIQDSIEFIRIIHNKWGALLDDMKDEDFSRTFIHPEGNYPTDLLHTLAMYVWHGNHHLAHIKLVTNPQ